MANSAPLEQWLPKDGSDQSTQNTQQNVWSSIARDNQNQATKFYPIDTSGSYLPEMEDPKAGSSSQRGLDIMPIDYLPTHIIINNDNSKSTDKTSLNQTDARAPVTNQALTQTEGAPVTPQALTQTEASAPVTNQAADWQTGSGANNQTGSGAYEGGAAAGTGTATPAGDASTANGATNPGAPPGYAGSTPDMSMDPLMQAADKQMIDGAYLMDQISTNPNDANYYTNMAHQSFEKAQLDLDLEAKSTGESLPEQTPLQLGDASYYQNANTRLSQYAPDPGNLGYDQLAYDARLASHEMQGDGAQEPDGPQGEIFLQTLLNGQNNGQASTFLDNPQDSEWFLQAMTKSFNQNGQLTGDVLTQSIADSFYQATGKDILPALSTQNSLSAVYTNAAVDQSFPDLTQPDGITQLEQDSGMSDKEIMADALFGHAQFEAPNGQINNSYMSQFLANADSPADFIDQPLINMSAGTQAAYESWVNSSDPAKAVEGAFLQTIGQEFGINNLSSYEGYSRSDNVGSGYDLGDGWDFWT